MALVVRLRTMNHPFLPDLPITQELVAKVHRNRLLIYSLIKSFLSPQIFYVAVVFSFIFIAHFFRGLAEACVNPESFFNSHLFVHSLVCLITHSFLHGFQPDLYQHFHHVCSTCHTIS